MINILKTGVFKIIYQPQFNFFLRSLNKILAPILPNKIKLAPSGTLIVNTDNGNLKIATNQTSYLTQVVFWKGYKAFEYSEIFEILIKNTTVFFDIGSNIGYYSLLAARANKNALIYAFEPATGPKYFIKKNIQLNHFQNTIFLVEKALSDKIGEIDFFEVENKKYNNLKYNLAGEGNAGTKTTSRNFVKNTVNCTTLDQFVFEYNISKIDLIKIDTEGTELDILKAGLTIIKACEPIIICETLYHVIEDELELFFKALNYNFYNHTDQKLKQVKTLKRTFDNGVRNCFFVPQSKLHLISKFVA